MGPLRFALASLVVISQQALANPQGHSPSAHLVDLSANHWCYDCVVKIVDEHKVLDGFQDHTFRGDWQVTRYALAATVARTYSQLKQARKLDIPSEGRAQDIGVLPDHWAYPYVRKLISENGLLLQFLQNGDFQGDKVVTRKEAAYALAEFIMKLETAMGSPIVAGRRESQLAVDLDPRSPYHESIDAVLNRYQLMNLYADHTFRADAPVTRYALSASLCKVFTLFENQQQAAQNP